MALQSQLFEGTLEGFSYRPELINADQESDLVKHVCKLPFQEFDFHGYKGKRRVVSFGWQYDFSGRQLKKANDIPGFLLPLRTLAASFAGLEPAAMQHVLVTEYGPGAGIGWHRDKAVFGQVVGISLLVSCTLRFRRRLATVAAKKQWERVNVLAEARSAYHLSGPARLEWEHSISRVDALRYSITFRNMREE
ncbi:MAG TPA: alpha-ketoglutarate-dependent dioxygenase AlkB [Pyrinomonadaceae bacterium]|nr:alpha-ketoglutarate-dependent dioxygenase AlkB [Pyrinomonadaceae bacterium]